MKKRIRIISRTAVLFSIFYFLFSSSGLAADIIGKFPSLLGSDGARAIDTDVVWLGELRDKEDNSKQVDVDNDDGVSADFKSCASSPVTFEVHLKKPGETSGIGYLNLFADWNRDGQWSGSDECAAEWALQNFPIDLAKQTDPIQSYIVPVPTGKETNVWYRAVVSYDEKLTRSDGGGEFSAGEVEDYGPTLNKRVEDIQEKGNPPPYKVPPPVHLWIFSPWRVPPPPPNEPLDPRVPVPNIPGDPDFDVIKISPPGSQPNVPSYDKRFYHHDTETTKIVPGGEDVGPISEPYRPSLNIFNIPPVFKWIFPDFEISGITFTGQGGPGGGGQGGGGAQAEPAPEEPTITPYCSAGQQPGDTVPHGSTVSLGIKFSDSNKTDDFVPRGGYAVKIYDDSGKAIIKTDKNIGTANDPLLVVSETLTPKHPSNAIESKVFKYLVSYHIGRKEGLAGGQGPLVEKEVECTIAVKHDPEEPTTPSGGHGIVISIDQDFRSLAPPPAGDTQTLNVFNIPPLIQLIQPFWNPPLPSSGEHTTPTKEGTNPKPAPTTSTYCTPGDQTIRHGQSATIKVITNNPDFYNSALPSGDLKDRSGSILESSEERITSVGSFPFSEYSYTSLLVHDLDPRVDHVTVDINVGFYNKVLKKASTQKVSCNIAIIHSGTAPLPRGFFEEVFYTTDPNKIIPDTQTLNVFQRIISGVTAWFSPPGVDQDPVDSGKGGSSGSDGGGTTDGGGGVIVDPGGGAGGAPPAGGAPAGGAAPQCYNTAAENKALEDACDIARNKCIDDADAAFAACSAKAVQDANNAVASDPRFENFNVRSCEIACPVGGVNSSVTAACKAQCQATERDRQDALGKAYDPQYEQCFNQRNKDLEKCQEDWKKCRNGIKECPPPPPEPTPSGGDDVTLKTPSAEPVSPTQSLNIFSIPPILQWIFPNFQIPGVTQTPPSGDLLPSPKPSGNDVIKGYTYSQEGRGLPPLEVFVEPFKGIVNQIKTITDGQVQYVQDLGQAAQDFLQNSAIKLRNLPPPGPENYIGARRIRDLIFGVVGDEADPLDNGRVLSEKLVEIVLPAPERIFALPSPTKPLEDLGIPISPFNFLSQRLLDLRNTLIGLSSTIPAPTDITQTNPQCLAQIPQDSDQNNNYTYRVACRNYENCLITARSLTVNGELISEKILTTLLVNGELTARGHIPTPAAVDVISSTCNGTTYSAFAHNYNSGRAGGSSPALNITTTSLAGGTANTAYSQTVSATAGGVGAYTWSISSGSLPTGLSLAAGTGVISGTPTTAATYNFTTQVTTGVQTTARALSIIIAAAIDDLVITTTSVPNKTGGVASSDAIVATGGTTPYTFSIPSQSPVCSVNNYSFSGANLISNNLGGTGTCNMTIRVTDSQGTPDTDDQDLTFQINP